MHDGECCDRHGHEEADEQKAESDYVDAKHRKAEKKEFPTIPFRDTGALAQCIERSETAIDDDVCGKPDNDADNDTWNDQQDEADDRHDAGEERCADEFPIRMRMPEVLQIGCSYRIVGTEIKGGLPHRDEERKPDAYEEAYDTNGDRFPAMHAVRCGPRNVRDHAQDEDEDA